MLRVPEIKQMLKTGLWEKAKESVDELLSFGPHNVEALKVKAQILGALGAYEDEFRIWVQIAKLEPSDMDVLMFFKKKEMEELQKQLFVEPAESGGVRFLVYPVMLIRSALLGLIGCAMFILLTRIPQLQLYLSPSWAMIIIFALLISVPWIAIVYQMICSLYEVIIDSEKMTLLTRFSSKMIPWAMVSGVTVISKIEDGPVEIVFEIKKSEEGRTLLTIPISESSGVLRPSIQFIKEVKRCWGGGEITYTVKN